jgi:SIR2-like domain/Sulfatase-modifying factor enzyme 1
VSSDQADRGARVRQNAEAGRDAYIAGRDVTVNNYFPVGTGQSAAPGLVRGTDATSEERDQYIRIAQEAAHRDAGHLVPVIGAGLSVSLGAPTWKELVARLRAASGLGPQVDELPRELLSRVKDHLGESQYETLIQQWLSLPDNRTSLAHQSIAAAGTRFVLTTNLDYAVERAFELAGRPLRPENVVIGSQPNSLRLLKGTTNAGTVLIKIRGTLQDPASWILDQKAYEAAYIGNDNVKDLWDALALRPLFIGFGFAYDDVREPLRAVEVLYQRGGYAIMSIEDIRNHSATLRRNGIMPIAVLNFEQVPEVVDEIFRCSPVRIEKRIEIGTNTRSLVVGAARIDVPQEFDEATEIDVSTAIANAVEIQPYSSLLTGELRRRYGQRGAYFDSLLKWTSAGELQKVAAVVDALIQYPDIFLGQLLPRSLRQQKPAEILKIMWKVADDNLRRTIKDNILATIDQPAGMSYGAMRSLAWFAATIMGSHPGMLVPPVTISLGNSLRIAKYPLTRYQVGTLRRGDSLRETYPIRPYTLTSRDEIYEILALLNRQASGTGLWRLPTDSEWKEAISLTSSGRWPWGDADPERGQHAHLKYLSGGAIAPHVLEVGVFPGDTAPVKDLIGNVYEVVAPATRADLNLAGGSWTTSFKSGTASRFSFISNWKGRFRDNVGLRPVLLVDKSARTAGTVEPC